jgi:hypothetical protein
MLTYATRVHVASSYYFVSGVLILLYVCPHTTICVSSYYYMCPHTTIYVSSYYYVCVLVLGALALCAKGRGLAGAWCAVEVYLYIPSYYYMYIYPLTTPICIYIPSYYCVYMYALILLYVYICLILVYICPDTRAHIRDPITNQIFWYIYSLILVHTCIYTLILVHTSETLSIC